VVNATAQEVLVLKPDSNPEVIDLSGNGRGIYYVRITLDSVTKTKKIVLK
jgi:hypothetical protein